MKQVSKVTERKEDSGVKHGVSRKTSSSPLATGADDKRIVQRAVADKSALTPQQVFAAQRTMGNRAVQRLIQRKLHVGAADDAYEREADRVADQVMSMPIQTTAPHAQRRLQDNVQRQPAHLSTIQRSSASSAFDAGPAVQDALAQSQGRGQSLPDQVRSQMESRFGRSFSAVRIHTEPQADQLNRSLSAQAFTSGSDIYFGQGQYNPASRSGQHLLAHELTHVAQQTGGQSIDGGAQRKTDAIQRKGNKGKPPTGTDTKATNDQVAMKDTPTGEDKSEKKEQDVFEENGLDAEYTNNDLIGTPATSHKFTLIVWRPGANYLPIQKLRAWSKMRNTVRAGLKSIPGIGRLVRNAKSGKDIKKRAIEKQAAKQPGYGASEDTKKDALKEMEAHSEAIGHTWIRLTSYVGDQIKQVSSYGFWPKSGFRRPDVAVKGTVSDPDHQHDKDSNVKALDTVIPATKFKAGVARVGRIAANPPDYLLIGYNCTKFGKEIAGVTGGKFSGAGNIFPAEPSKGLLQRIFSPDELYGKMAKNKDSYDTLANVPKRKPHLIIDMSSYVREREPEPEVELPEVADVYQCVKELTLKTSRGGTITADSGTQVMVRDVDYDNTIHVEKQRSSATDFNTRGTCTPTEFWASCIHA